MQVSPTQDQSTQLDDVLAEYMSVLAADGYDLPVGGRRGWPPPLPHHRYGHRLC